MAQVQTECVLVVPTRLFHQLGHFQGFSTDVPRYVGELLSDEHTSYRPHHKVEEDPSFKQSIPYVIFRYRDPQGRTRMFSTRAEAEAKAKGDCTAKRASASEATFRSSIRAICTATRASQMVITH